MFKSQVNKRGIVLLMVLGMLLVVVALTNAILSIISSNYRFTHHQVSRIQAYYAAMAGTNYALEQLRSGAWRYSPSNSCPNTDPATCTVSDSGFPKSIVNQRVDIIFCPSGDTCYGTSAACNPPGGFNFCIDATATYTYSES